MRERYFVMACYDVDYEWSSYEVPSFLREGTVFRFLPREPVIDKDLVFSFPDKLINLSKTRVSNARGSPRGTLMPSPRAAIKLRMPHPRD